MMRLRILLSLVILLSCFVTLQAQVVSEKNIRPKQEIKIGDLMYAEGHYYSAVGYYQEAIRELGGGRTMKKTARYRYAMYWLAMSYLKGRDYENALKHFIAFHNIKPGTKDKVKRFEKENNEIYELSKFYYAEALKHNEKYDEAIKQYRAFISGYDYEDKKEWKQRTDNAIAGAELGKEWLGKSKKVKVKSLGDGVNSKYTEASPVASGDSTVIYTSLRSNKLIFVDRRKDVPPTQLYESKLQADGTWSKGRALPDIINEDKEAGIANAAYSEDGKRLYFCKCYNKEVDEVLCNLWMTEQKQAGKWSEPVKLNESINSSKYTSTQPTVRTAGDGVDIVYYVSDKPGGKGGMDIWYFIRTKRGGFRGPRVVKNGINTPGDELTPYFDNERSRLYFSSNGHPSIGGFDVFMAREDSTLGWSEVQNVGKPINSPADDLSYSRLPGEGGRGMLSSNREGALVVNQAFTGDDLFYFEDFKYGLEGLVLRETEEGNLPAGPSIVTLYQVYEDGTEERISVDSSAVEDYFFKLEPDADYRVEIEKPGFSTKIEQVTTRDLPMEDTIQKNLVVNRNQVQCAGKVYATADTDKTQPLTDVFVTLYEVQGGNKNQLALNRLTETKPEFGFTVATERDYRIEISKEGFFKGSFDFDTKGLADDEENVCNHQFITKIEENKTYELENIEYEFNSAELTDASKEVLDNLLTIMQDNPGLIIELSAHTDSKGSDSYNLELSQKRAQSCVDYLMERGISDERLVAKGYGESVPIAPNQNDDGSDNPEGRSRNRRTEFKVIGNLQTQ